MVPQRFAIVISKNGVGESQTLAQIVDAALAGSLMLTEIRGDRPLCYRILGFHLSVTITLVFPSDRRKRARA